MTMPLRTGIENRRSPRVVRRVPLRIEESNGRQHEGFSAVINTHGALLIADLNFPDDTVVLLENLLSGTRSRARVIWSSSQDGAAGFKLGVEFLDGVDFWGDDYDPATAG
jgi:hypothetical protein